MNGPTLAHDKSLLRQSRVFRDLSVSEFSKLLGLEPTHEVKDDIKKHIEDLHLRLNNNEDVRCELDSYLPLIWMQTRGINTSLPTDYYILRREDVFGVHNLIDIGEIVRDIIMRRQNNSLLFRIVQYCMPYIKHNRLCFSWKLNDTNNLILPELIKVMLATCLGIYKYSTRKPLWKNRIKLSEAMYNLLAHGSLADHFQFCENHMPLLRISMIEYFVYFVTVNMPAEMKVLSLVFRLNCQINDLFMHFRVAIDTFRQTSFHNNELDWDAVISNANFACEKCNRISKSKTSLISQNITRKEVRIENRKVPIDTIRTIIETPVHRHAAYLRVTHPHLTLEKIRDFKIIYSRIELYHLPSNVTYMQCRRILEHLECESESVLQPAFLSVCLSCVDMPSYKPSLMRLCGINGVTCGSCHRSETVVQINLIGRIVRASSKLYYYCIFCHQAHEWSATGTEFTHCDRSINTNTDLKAVLRKCLFCQRSIGLMPFTCVDEFLGVKNTFMLCTRHTPPEYLQPYIYNYESFLDFQSRKRGRGI